MLRIFVAMALILTLSGCITQAKLDTAIQQSAPKACATAETLYSAFIASDRGSAKTRATVNAAYQSVYQLCRDPSSITSAQLLIVIAQTSAIIRTIRSAK